MCRPLDKKMPTGPLFKAVRKGNVEVSVSPLHTNLPIPHLLIKVDTSQHTNTHFHMHTYTRFAHTHTCTYRYPCTHDPPTLSLSLTHSLTHIPCTHSKTLTHTHPNTVAHIYSPRCIFTHVHTHASTCINTITPTIILSHTHTPQQVKQLLTSGIKPDAERDNRGVSVFWCRLD